MRPYNTFVLRSPLHTADPLYRTGGNPRYTLISEPDIHPIKSLGHPTNEGFIRMLYKSEQVKK